MGTTESTMGLQSPTISGDPGTWGTQLNANHPLIAAHDHTTGKGVPVPSAGIGINANLTMAGHALTNLKAAAFTAQASFTTAASLWVRSSDSALVWRSVSGTDFKLADSTGINLSLVGGIAGDYATASASLYYDNTAEAYRFLEATPLPNSWSYVKAGGVDIYQHASGISTFVRIISPAALAASYTITKPAALPASTQLQQITSGGVETYSNTIANAVVLQAGVQVTGGAADFDAASSIAFPSRVKHVDAINGVATAGSVTYDGTGRVVLAAATTWDVGVDLHQGDRVTAVRANYSRDAAVNMTFALYQRNVGGSISAVVTGADNVNTGSQTLLLATASNLPYTVPALASGGSYFLRCTGGSGDNIDAWAVTYDRPSP